MKGDGETHPAISPTAEFLGLERWDKGGFGPQPETPDKLSREMEGPRVRSKAAHGIKWAHARNPDAGPDNLRR